MMRLFLSLLLVTSCALGAVNTTAPNLVRLYPLFETIHVVGYYTNDDNVNCTATVQYRTNNGTWRNAYTPFIDRRARLVADAGTIDNVNSNQVRIMIRGLVPGTSYDVKVDWADGDGIVGAASITNTVSTLRYSIPTNGTILYADGNAVAEGSGTTGSPYKTITNALVNAVAGDTIKCRTASYDAFVITNKSGTSNAWIVIMNDEGHTPTIKGGTAVNNVLLAGNYIAFDGFNMAASTNSGIRMLESYSGLWVQNCRWPEAVLDLSSGAAGAGCIRLMGFNTNIFINSNAFHSTRVTSTDTSIYPMVLGSNTVNWTFNDNTSTNFWDVVGTGNAHGSGVGINGVAMRNYIKNQLDDSIEIEGDFNGFLMEGNTVNSTNGSSLLGLSGPYVGPIYVNRNYFAGTNMAIGSIGMKYQSSKSPAPIYFFHNLISTFDYTVGAGGHETFGGGTNGHIRNNIIMANGNIYFAAKQSDADYNLYTNTINNPFADSWNGNTYSTFSDFKTGTGLDTHSLYSPVIFQTGTYLIETNCAARDAGQLLDNFNDNYNGTAPDIGPYELPEVTIAGQEGKRIRRKKNN